MEISENFLEWRHEFNDGGGELLEFYMEACETVPEWLESNFNDLQGFRDELAAHIRDSSAGPASYETQWGTDERMRNLWFDVFGAEPPPGDPYPVPRERWGRHRMTTYMRDLQPSHLSRLREATRQWLEARGITAEDLAAYHEPGAEREYSRPEPVGFRQRLAELTAAGRRSGPAEGEYADQARADLLEAKRGYLETGHPEEAAAVDKLLADREPRDE
ncbi:hypothetical protein [Jiangella anatolica]|uniref:Uncharacterized protein n=1 Tax=Jiangella anatolica TaxID=2670374 RepID=A0A2W2C0F3_9ACTN|nr:hypothetical protein [Jiangella anatolica]PZF81779.1 hypothetical protein C1I92_19770 [Jiangella anatolica]